ncbi:AAA family ATPase [Acetobacter estunensis]|uniref:AAA family ATPase n=1 Tax=Acetobacter estunensis TaxID=104097 RepID=UPI001C2DCD8B|nr:AAA family ATPase [Acetobacter estunensis]MBV1837176.1 helicase RepA family protein [Acetobacter estunensis]
MSEAVDIGAAVESGFRKVEERPTKAPPFENISVTGTPLLIDADEWDENDIAPRPWIAPGLLLRGAVTVVVGEPAAGKSMLMVGWATSLVLGERYGRLNPVQCCKVVTYNTEDDNDEQKRRFSAALRPVGKQPSDLTNGLFRVSTEGIGTLLRTAEGGGIIATPAMEQLQALIEEQKPDVLILDPLVELHEMEENDNTAIRAVMAYFRSLAIRYDMAVVLLHHTRKGSAGIAGNPDIARGASSIIGAARVVVTVAVMTEQEADSFSVPADHRRYFSRVDTGKINAAPTGREEWFERQAYELPNGDSVAAMLPWAPPDDTVGLEQRVVIEAGIAKGSSEGPWSPKLSNDTRSVRRLFVENGITSQKAQRAALDHLLASGCTVETFKRSNNAKAQGIRSHDGHPSSAKWLSGDGE